MPKTLPWRSVLLLLFANLVLIVHCYGDFGYRSSRERSSYHGSSYVRSDRTNVQTSRFDGNPSARIQQQQKEPSAAQQPISSQTLSERLHTIFAFPAREGINWINTTTDRLDTQPIDSTPQSTKTSNVADDDNCREQKQGKTYCEHVPNYAEQTQLHRVSRVDLDRFKELFVEDVIEPTDVKIRMKNGDPEDIELCRSKSKVVYPQRGLTKNSEWKYIYQSSEVKQGMLEEVCENPDKPCEFSENFPSAYVSRCKQYQSYRLLVSIENGTLSTKEFIVSGACKCVLRPVLTMGRR